jgi:hypothetical protein
LPIKPERPTLTIPGLLPQNNEILDRPDNSAGVG